MIRTQISMDQKEYELAKEEARKLGISLAELFRRALRGLFSFKKGKPWMRYQGFVESGSPTSSQDIDEIIYGQKN